MNYITYLAGTLMIITGVTAANSNRPTKDELLQQGHEYRRQKDFKKAKEYFLKALKEDPMYSAAQSSLQGVEKELKIQEFKGTLPADCRKENATDDELSKCAKEYFVYKGKPLNVKMVFDLIPWIQDNQFQVLAVDVGDSFEADRYFEGDNYSIEKKERWFKVILNETDPSVRYYGDSTLSYEILGKTTSEVYVIRIVNFPNRGTGVFSSLLFVKVETEPKFQFVKDDASGSTRYKAVGNRIVLRKLADYRLGDRMFSEIKINGNTVEMKLTPQLTEECQTETLELDGA